MLHRKAKKTYQYKAGFLSSLKVDSQEEKVSGLVIECCRQFVAHTPSFKPFFPKSIQLRPLSNLCYRRNLTLVKSACVTAPKSFFWAPACVPGFSVHVMIGPEINEQHLNCLLALISEQNALLDWEESVWFDNLLMEQWPALLTCRRVTSILDLPFSGKKVDDCSGQSSWHISWIIGAYWKSHYGLWNSKIFWWSASQTSLGEGDQQLQAVTLFTPAGHINCCLNPC